MNLDPFTPPPTDIEEGRRVHHLTYSFVPDPRRHPKAVVGRDSGAFNDLRTRVEEIGYDWGSETFMHYNPGQHSDGSYGSVPLPRGDIHRTRAGFPQLTEDSCGVMCTRTPISDKKADGRNAIDRSRDLPETCVFRVVRRYFSKISRFNVEMNGRFLERLSSFRDKSEPPLPMAFSFGRYCDARVTEVKLSDGSVETFNNGPRRYRSIAFFIHVASMPKFRSRLILAFGMGSAETAAWCRIIRRSTSCHRWFDGPRLVVAGLEFQNVPTQARSLHYADYTRVIPLIDQPLDEFGQPAKSNETRGGRQTKRGANIAPIPTPAK